MKRITEKYADHSKDDLLSEVESRAKAGRKFDVGQSSLKGDVVAALELDDESQGGKGVDPKTGNVDQSQPIVRNNPVVASAKNEVNVTQPDPNDYKGKFLKESDGEVYGLCVVENDPLGRTHKARNDEHFWEGTKAEFKEQFEKQ